MKPEWNVYISNFNHGVIETYNVFTHYSFLEDCRRTLKQYNKNYKANGVFDRDEFSKDLGRILMYYFWSKCEWEIILQHWPESERFKDEKIDVYDQIRLNWDIFVDYVWGHREEILRWKIM